MRKRTIVNFKKLIVLTVFVLAVAAMQSCKKYDDTDIYNKYDNLDDRVAALETWQKTVNGDITALKSITDAMKGYDYITGVTQVENGYEITFDKKGTITILNGKNGANGQTGPAPSINVKIDEDGNYYWTLNGEWMLDASGNKVRANGMDGVPGGTGQDGITPQVRINGATDFWEVSTDGGTTWTSTGVKATGDKGEDGDNMFANVSYSNDNYVIFVMSNGDTYKVAKYPPMRIAFYDNSVSPVVIDNSFETQNFIMRIGTVDNEWLTTEDFGSIKAVIESRSTVTADVTISTQEVSVNKWKVEIVGPLVRNDQTIALPEIRVTVPLDIEDEDAMLTVTLYNKKGMSASVSRVLQYRIPTVTVATAGTLSQTMADAGIDVATVNALRIKGSIDKSDFDYLRLNTPWLYNLDLKDADIKGCTFDGNTYNANEIPALAFASQTWLNDDNDPSHGTLNTIIVPRSATKIGNGAFALCSNLEHIIFPEGTRMRTIGQWIGQYSSLQEIIIPASVTTLEASAFWGCTFLKKVSFEKGCILTKLPDYCFSNCIVLESISLPASIKYLGDDCFSYDIDNYEDAPMEFIDAPGVTSIGNYVLFGRKNLKKIMFGATIISCGSQAFESASSSDFSNTELYVNEAEKLTAVSTAWRNATWKSIDLY